MCDGDINKGLPTTTKVPPIMITVPTSWNVLVNEAAGCGGRLGDCCGRPPVMNARNARNRRLKPIFVGETWLLGRLYIEVGRVAHQPRVMQ